MKKVIKTLIILLFIQGYSQQGKIIYTASINKVINHKKLNKLDKEGKKEILNSLKNSKEVEYELLFNNNSSLFQKVEQMKNEHDGFNITEILAGKGKYFFDSKTEKTIELKDAFGEVFLIDKKRIKWNFIDETKKIGNHLCKKATTSISIENSRGIINKDVVAWYTLEIPLNYGPKNYNGLPGLILELKEDKLIFLSKKIILNSKETITIKKPTKGKKITEKEYNKIGKKMYLKRKEGM